MSDTMNPIPFQIEVPAADLDDLRQRLARVRWPAQPEAAGWERGVPLDVVVGFAEYWRSEFDWRSQERALNAWPQFTVSKDGQPIHFMHIKSTESDALPLLLVHGWPSSPVEFLKLIDSLVAPSSPDGEAGGAFDLVIPSLPGYAFSTPLAGAGWGNMFRVAQTLAELMACLGYDRYGVHGTDVGSGVASILGVVDAQHVVGAHIAGTVAAMPFGPALDLDWLEPADRARAERFNEFQANGIGYLHLQATRPQTLAYSLVDSPAGQLAWILDRYWAGIGLESASLTDAFERDQLLTNTTIYWLTRSGASTANTVYEGMQAWKQMASQGEQPSHAGSPVGVAVFGSDTTIRSVMDPGGQIAHWSNFDRGGHFPAMETPELLIDDLRQFFAQVA